MRRRQARAATDLAAPRPVLAFGVLRRYDPRTLTSVAAMGYGAAAATSGGTVVRGPDGQLRSALADGATQLVRAGARAAARYAPLPPRVLAVVTADEVSLYEWTMFGAGAVRARWPRGGFAAQAQRFVGETGVRVLDPSGRVALLTARSGFARRWPAALVAAIVAHAAVPAAG